MARKPKIVRSPEQQALLRTLEDLFLTVDMLGIAGHKDEFWLVGPSYANRYVVYFPQQGKGHGYDSKQRSKLLGTPEEIALKLLQMVNGELL